MKTSAYLLALAVLALAVATCDAGDWAHWRGPEQSGVSRRKALARRLVAGRASKNVLWDLAHRWTLHTHRHERPGVPELPDHPRRERSPAEDSCPGTGGVSRRGHPGQVLWQDVFNVFQTDVPAPRVGWAAMVGDPETGHVYVHTVSGLFRCYTPDGKIVWEHSLLEDFGRISGYGGRTQDADCRRGSRDRQLSGVELGRHRARHRNTLLCVRQAIGQAPVGVGPGRKTAGYELFLPRGGRHERDADADRRQLRRRLARDDARTGGRPGTS